MPEQPTPTPVAAPPEEAQRADPLASAVAEAVGKLRRSAGLSERAAARRLGTSQTQLRRMEDPRYLPSLRSLARVATAYGAELKVSFESPEVAPKEKLTPPKERPVAAKERPAALPRPAPKPARASASPSRSRRAAPGRARAGSRRPARGAARRRKAR